MFILKILQDALVFECVEEWSENGVYLGVEYDKCRVSIGAMESIVGKDVFCVR